MSEQEREFKPYKRKGVIEMRPYIYGEDVSEIGVAQDYWPGTDMGMIARDPLNHSDQWYVPRAQVEANYELDK